MTLAHPMWPSARLVASDGLNSELTTLKGYYFSVPPKLENDEDEPIIPHNDREVIFFAIGLRSPMRTPYIGALTPWRAYVLRVCSSPFDSSSARTSSTV